MTVGPAGHTAEPETFTRHASLGSCPMPMDEADTSRAKLIPEDTPVSSSIAADSISLEDAHYVALRDDLEASAQDLEAESWSTAVEQQYLMSLSKDTVKRQDIIYELMQTEVHHVRTLKLLLYVYMHELRDSLHMEDTKLERLFPQVHVLLELHQYFLDVLKQRRLQALEPHCPSSYCIPRLGDILISQFSGERGERMRDCYGVFCSHHSDAVRFYKEQLQNNKKFQSLMRKIGQLPIVRRLTFPECILLVTQRITKYPVLVERIIQYTEGNPPAKQWKKSVIYVVLYINVDPTVYLISGLSLKGSPFHLPSTLTHRHTPADTEEHDSLVHALALIKDTISQVDAQVHKYEKAMRLREIGARLEPKPRGRMKDGRAFSREDMAYRTLLHEGKVNYKAPSGRLKEVHAVLLPDVLLLLQDKDQKFTFAVLDNKPSVVSLQRLIVRDIALEERGMFLICASSSRPEMYEMYAGSRQERDTWMTFIRGTVDSCPELEEELYSEQEETRAGRLRELQERLSEKDAQVVQSLTEKLQILADFSKAVPGFEDLTPPPRLLLRSDASDVQQGEQLLNGAITDVENLQNLLLSCMKLPFPPGEELPGLEGRRVPAETSSTSSNTPVKNGGLGETPASDEGGPGERRSSLTSHPQPLDPQTSKSLELAAGETPSSDWNSTCSSPFPEFFNRVLKLSQRLYSLKAFTSQQDSHLELQRALLSSERPARQRSSVLLEQEKHRHLEKQREELASFHRMQAQLRQEQARSEREAERWRAQAEAEQARLHLRHEECQRLAEQLAEERAELERQRASYQQDLERLRESTKAVEKERERLERLETQKKPKKHNTISNPGHLSFGLAAQSLAMAQSSEANHLAGSQEGSFLFPSPKTRVRPGIPGMYPSSPLLEEPPKVPPRKESISPLPAKAEVPLHLVSTTNQANKPGLVQQKIPTKLAAVSRDKEKSSRGKGSHLRTHSAANIDLSKVVPIRVTGTEGGSLRTKRTRSPQHVHISDCFSPPESHANVKPSQSFSAHKRTSQDTPPEPPPFPKDIGTPSQERVVFL